ncbi:rhodanese-like domain-containing protein [Novipirellula artificiosorum]|uniref:Inner membrane protein YgaP n=1 Tax=Novipirellula artificiosorum TaxID=2528016 RepID=A0A5C6DU04_9BACT|nr:rhodanese-like domain-containing protein [Novipirellula artificiosorum]TWU39704.1 Inner membrane protein YgaP [Novipirellula artificiosorum]
MQTIDVKQLADKATEGEVDLIDVRMPTEFREVHAECAKNVPLESLDPNEVAGSRSNGSAEPIYLICRSGNRSAQACKKFIDAGIENVVNVEGGTTAWAAAGLPVVRGKKAFPLMQQVQITAGFLVVLGVVLGYFVHPYFVALSGFVGAGLMFAGSTGLCPMASLIAKMPWNQCGGGSCSA